MTWQSHPAATRTREASEFHGHAILLGNASRSPALLPSCLLSSYHPRLPIASTSPSPSCYRDITLWLHACSSLEELHSTPPPPPQRRDPHKQERRPKSKSIMNNSTTPSSTARTTTDLTQGSMMSALHTPRHEYWCHQASLSTLFLIQNRLLSLDSKARVEGRVILTNRSRLGVFRTTFSVLPRSPHSWFRPLSVQFATASLSKR